HRLQPAKNAVGAPIFGELGGGARHAALMVLQLRLEALQKGEGVGRGPGEAGEHLAVVQLANLVGIAFHHDVAKRHLAITTDGHAAVTPYSEDGRRMNRGRLPFHVNKLQLGVPPTADSTGAKRQAGREVLTGTGRARIVLSPPFQKQLYTG